MKTKYNILRNIVQILEDRYGLAPSEASDFIRTMQPRFESRAFEDEGMTALQDDVQRLLENAGMDDVIIDLVACIICEGEKIRLEQLAA